LPPKTTVIALIGRSGHRYPGALLDHPLSRMMTRTYAVPLRITDTKNPSVPVLRGVIKSPSSER
jgi:hypothetical protein